MKTFYAQNPEYFGNGACDAKCTVCGEKYRFSVLTPNLLRLEYSESGVFEDRPSQVVLNRVFPVPEFRVRESETCLEISTEAFHLVYNKKKFSPENLYIDVKNRYTNYGGRWKYGALTYGNPPRHHNLMGTARTLDKIDGELPLELGLQDRSGRSFFDDSHSLLFTGQGWLAPRTEGNTDVYFFCYHHDYFHLIADFYRLTGAPPMLPRYAYGNWWSRYWKYTEESYLELLERFRAEELPFSVAILDMDWHITDVPPEYGRGWTGYTWNKKFFPDPKRFLKALHGKGLHCGLNLHPADGIQGFEDAYPQMAAALGVDTSCNEPVNFDIASPEFIRAYFQYAIHPHEKDGVDFWWIDWQQGTESGMKGLDPLWALNHFHFLDGCRNDHRGMILSRYAGLGSHRYPIGFSGDTIATWNSLDFQPYFTANAANVGYHCWSHDIGGFKTGISDRELYIRWIQFGVFSPVMRLHSSNNPFCNKEPWVKGKQTLEIARRYLNLRHRLIPYIYTGYYVAHTKLRPMITPLYYHYPDCDAAYRFRNEYFFGDALLVCPITSPTNVQTDRASVQAYLPEGVWTDVFGGRVYRGKRVMTLNRTVEEQAVLAKAGAIVPLAHLRSGDNSTGNPNAFDIYVFPGDNGHYELFEDSGDGYDFRNGKYVLTEFSFTWGERSEFRIQTTGATELVNETRSYRLHFRGFAPCRAEGSRIRSQQYDPETHTLSVELAPVAVTEPIEVFVEDTKIDGNTDYQKRVFDFLLSAQLPVTDKNEIYRLYQSAVCREDIAVGLQSMQISKAVTDVLYELTFSN